MSFDVQTDLAEDSHLPAKISPEGLRVAEAYIENGEDAVLAAAQLGMEVAEVERMLKNRQVRSYVDRIYFESGFRNRARMGRILDGILHKKLEELDESEMGSSMDIMDILKIMHKMKMDEMEMAHKIAKEENAVRVNNQTNIQFNSTEAPNYNALLDRLIKG